MTDYNSMIETLYDYFCEHGNTKPIEYAYGFKSSGAS